MTSFALFALCGALALIVELLSTLCESKAIVGTAVSSLPDTDYKRPVSVKIISFAAIALFLAFLLVAAIVEAPPWFCAPILVLFAIFRWSFARQLARNARASQAVRTVKALMLPEIARAVFAFHLSEPDQSGPEHLLAWNNEIDSLEVPWFVILRERRHIKAFRAVGMPPAVFIEGRTLLYICLPKLVKAVFYANNGQKNRAMIEACPQVKHVQLLHGDSDKPPSFSPLSRNYDLLFVAGQMAIDRYVRHKVHIHHDRFRMVGRPQVRAITTAQSVDRGARLNVLYMPTWRGLYEDTRLSSLESASRIINKLLVSDILLNIEFKPHPMSYDDPSWPLIRSEANTAFKNIYPNGNAGHIAAKDADPFDLYNKADILITDISSVMIDFLYSYKPYLVIVPKNFSAKNEFLYPSLAAGYKVQNDLKNLNAMIGLAADEDPLASKRAEVRDYAFGDVERPPGEAFHEACNALIKNNNDRSLGPLKEGKSNDPS